MKRFRVRDPATGDTFELGEEEYFLCQALDGLTSHEDIKSRYAQFFGRSLTDDDVAKVIAMLNEHGMLETVKTDRLGPRAGVQQTSDIDPFEDEETGGSRTSKMRWSLFNPERHFDGLVKHARAIRWLVFGMIYSLIPGLPLSFYLLYKNQEHLAADLAAHSVPMTYIGRMLLTLILINLVRCIASGTVCRHYGGQVREFGIRLRFGIIPRFYVDRSSVRDFGRHEKLWSYATSLLLRLIIVELGVFCWYLSRSSGTQLSAWGIILAHAGLIGFVIVSLPIRTSDGYNWLVTFFKLPPTLLQQAVDVMLRVLTRKPLPSQITRKQRTRLVAYAAFLFIAWGWFFFRVSSSIIGGLSKSFPGVFGRSTEVIAGLIVLLLIGRWLLPRVRRLVGPAFRGGSGLSSDVDDVEYETHGEEAVDRTGRNVLIAIVIVLVLFLPYPFRLGGDIEMMPPAQQDLQAPVSGEIAEVFFDGGDGTKISRNTTVARMISSEIENEIATLKERITQQQAQLDKSEIFHKKLVSGPRPEEVAESEAQWEGALDEVKVVEKRLKAATVSASYSSQEVSQLQILYKEGAYPLLDVEEARRRAELAAIAIEEEQDHLAASQKGRDQARAQLDLLLNGTAAEDVEAAQQEVNAANAELRRLKQELKHAQQQQADTALVMPFDGYLLKPYLRRKVGTYLQHGETFATAQNDGELLVEVEIPEYDAGSIMLGAIATVKLVAYPSSPLSGNVIAMEPAGSELDYGRVFKLVVRLENEHLNLKPGMSGYCKIDAGWKPIIVQLTRPILRFLQIEVWSWLP